MSASQTEQNAFKKSWKKNQRGSRCTLFYLLFPNFPNDNNDPARSVTDYQQQCQLIEDSVQPNPPNWIQKEFSVSHS